MVLPLPEKDRRPPRSSCTHCSRATVRDLTLSQSLYKLQLPAHHLLPDFYLRRSHFSMSWCKPVSTIRSCVGPPAGKGPRRPTGKKISCYKMFILRIHLTRLSTEGLGPRHGEVRRAHQMLNAALGVNGVCGLRSTRRQRNQVKSPNSKTLKS